LNAHIIGAEGGHQCSGTDSTGTPATPTRMARAGTKSVTLPEAHELPEFASEDEEREWWASHDTSELPGEDVPLQFAGSRVQGARTLKVHTDQRTVNRLKQLAAERGLDYHEMLRTWIHQRLEQEDASQ
ncbi:MAG: BrnA antitoxin family protein, partial [Chloroflexota bacterium]|nr:BrnA antitoxin family protein [Chloroflexota bacterium]